MIGPTVCCILLTRDRPQMAARAVRCFREQTYREKELLILDTGTAPNLDIAAEPNEDYFWMPQACGLSIGHLRNMAITVAIKQALPDYPPDIIVHVDDDDYSHPSRIEEQVAFLQTSGADAVGYGEMPFWDSRKDGEAWIYRARDPRHFCGTSLCYWRKTWERQPFPELNTGEDHIWGLHVKNVRTVSALHPDGHPRMVAAIHGSNTGSEIKPLEVEWRREPKADYICRKVMEL